jgi:aspartyl-tRNA(Asn)/glutamyl-tRNA(Gln) amidotransferase subunit A
MQLQPRSVTQLASLIQGGTLDPIGVIEETFARIETYPDPAIFTCLTKDRALAEAHSAGRRLREGRSLGPLDGVPIAWKDLFDVVGLATTAGSRVMKTSTPARQDAGVVAMLAAAGMITVGRNEHERIRLLRAWREPPITARL